MKRIIIITFFVLILSVTIVVDAKLTLPSNKPTKAPESSSTKPTTTPFNCGAIKDSGQCNSGQAATYCNWCNGGCKNKSSCPSPTYSPSASSSSSGCTVTINLANHISVGDTEIGTVTTRGICGNLSIDRCSNVTDCKISNGKIKGTVAKACTEISVSVKESRGAIASGSIKYDSVKNKWQNTPVTAKKNTSTMADSAENANKSGLDAYYTTCSTPNGGVEYCVVYRRNSCVTGAPPAVETPPPTPTPTYDYCCVKTDKTDYSWKTGQTSKTCPNDYRVDTTITSSADCSLACYEVTSGDNKGELIWTNKSSTGTKTDKKKDACKNCYMNKSTWKESTVAKYVSHADADLEALIFIAGKDATTCEKPPEIKACTIEDYVEKASGVDASSCEASGTEISYNEGKTCDGYKYYEIKCTNKIIVNKFDNNDDGMYGNYVKTVNTIYPGQGFSFGISSKIIRTCEGTFYSKEWSNDYNILEKASKSLNVEENRIMARNAMDDLKKIVDDYNTYGYANVTDLGGSFSVSYDTYTSDKKEVLKTNFAVKEPVYEGTGKFTSQTTLNLGVSGVVNPKNYRWSNEEDPKIIRMYFPIAYIDKATGVVTDQKTGIIGGNKLYTKGSAKAGENNMAITLYSPSNAVIENAYAKITNNKCKLKIVIPDVKYRPMNVANPFINNEYEKGHNWVNEHYDFTKIIEPDIWTRSPETVIELSPSDIKEIKINNAFYINQGKSPYYGLCKTPYINNDDFAKQLCEKLDIR